MQTRRQVTWASAGSRSKTLMGTNTLKATGGISEQNSSY